MSTYFYKKVFMDLMEILHQQPWIDYKDLFVRSNIVLQYPKNLIFTLQYLKRHIENPIYDQYPHAERFDVSTLQSVDWIHSIIAFNANDSIVVAPEPLKVLINLERRLRPIEAGKVIFDPFRCFPIHFFRYDWVMWIILGTILIVWLRLHSYMTYLVLTPTRL